MKRVLTSGMIIFLGLSVLAGTRPDSSGFQSRTPFRLYLPVFGPPMRFSPTDLVKIAENFDLLYGLLPSVEELEYIRAINPEFRALRYYGSWTHACLKETHDLQAFERELRDAMLYYGAAVLVEDMDREQTRLRVSQVTGELHPGNAHPDSTWSYTVDGEVRFHTFLRAGEECMRIVSVKGDSVEVERGFMDTQPAAHPSGSALLSPLYNTNPNRPDIQSFAYHLDPRHPIRWDYLSGKCIQDMKEHGASGIYIDILGSTTLRATRMDGVITGNYWDRELDSVYSPDQYRRASERGLRHIQDSVYEILGRYPVIWGNNMTASRYRDGEHDRYKFLVSTEDKPRPIDGYMIEDAWGGYSIEQWVDFDTNGTVICPGKASPGTHGYRNWELNLAEIMDCAENGWAAAPQMINGGMKNHAFEFLSPEQQHDWFCWAYASFLLGLQTDENGNSPLWQGITARISGQGPRHITIDPCLQWKVGIPTLTFGPEEADRYKVTGHTYLRTFSNGVVLVNPHTVDDPETISLSSLADGPYIDPDTGDTLDLIRMPAQTGKILLKEYDPLDYPDYPEAGSEPYRGRPYYESPFPVPTAEPVPMVAFDRGELSGTVFDPDIHPEHYYMPRVRDDKLDAYPKVELTGDPPGIFRVSSGEYWRYSIRVEKAGLYYSRLHYGGSAASPVERAISLTIFSPDSMHCIYSDTVHFDFGPGIAPLPLYFTNIRLDTGKYVVQWQGHYTGARPNLDAFTLYTVHTGKAEKAQSLVEVFPVPFRSILHIRGAGAGTVKIFDLQGRLLISRNLQDDSELIETGLLMPGTYILLVSRDRETHRQVVIKVKQ